MSSDKVSNEQLSDLLQQIQSAPPPGVNPGEDDPLVRIQKLVESMQLTPAEAEDLCSRLAHLAVLQRHLKVVEAAKANAATFRAYTDADIAPAIKMNRAQRRARRR